MAECREVFSVGTIVRTPPRGHTKRKFLAMLAEYEHQLNACMVVNGGAYKLALVNDDYGQLVIQFVSYPTVGDHDPPLYKSLHICNVGIGSARFNLMDDGDMVFHPTTWMYGIYNGGRHSIVAHTDANREALFKQIEVTILHAVLNDYGFTCNGLNTHQRRLRHPYRKGRAAAAKKQSQ